MAAVVPTPASAAAERTPCRLASCESQGRSSQPKLRRRDFGPGEDKGMNERRTERRFSRRGLLKLGGQGALLVAAGALIPSAVGRLGPPPRRRRGGGPHGLARG